MITQLKYVIGNGFIPYENLAIEEYLLHLVNENECILYLWQNRDTVVIGRNQDAALECRVQALKDAGGYLVRRLSGGGAVYHDLSNLNFTFLVRKSDYDLNKQMDVILKAIQKFGISAEKSGRNDIIIDSKKVSGNAFFSTNGRNYHHGTLLLDVNKDKMAQFLNVSTDKLASKGVKSVKSRVTSLKEYRKDITVDDLKRNLITSFEEVYGLKAEKLDMSDVDRTKIEQLAKKYSSEEFIFGRKINSQCEWNKRFSWGNAQVKIELRGGYINDAIVYSDALDERVISEIGIELRGCLFLPEEISKRLEAMKTENNREILEDIEHLICENLK